jgi:hypothetical protein
MAGTKLVDFHIGLFGLLVLLIRMGEFKSNRT